MTHPTIADIRAMLFEQMRNLEKPTANAETLDKSKAMADLAQTIINTGKLELEFMKHTGSMNSDFIPSEKTIEPPRSITPTGIKTVGTQPNGMRQVTHKLA